MRKGCVWLIVLAVACGLYLYADSVTPPSTCIAGGNYVHYLCATDGAVTPVNPFDPPIGGDLANLGQGSTVVFIEGPWFGHRNKNLGDFQADWWDWVYGPDELDKKYGRQGTERLFQHREATTTDREFFSYYLRAVSNGSGTITGSLTFHYPVVAVVATNDYGPVWKLNSSNGLFAATNASGTALQGYGIGAIAATWGLDADAQDWIMVDQGGYRVQFSFNFGSAGELDSIRILTATPESAALVLFGTVAAALFGAKRLRNRRGA